MLTIRFRSSHVLGLVVVCVVAPFVSCREKSNVTVQKTPATDELYLYPYSDVTQSHPEADKILHAVLREFFAADHRGTLFPKSLRSVLIWKHQAPQLAIRGIPDVEFVVVEEEGPLDIPVRPIHPQDIGLRFRFFPNPDTNEVSVGVAVLRYGEYHGKQGQSWGVSCGYRLRKAEGNWEVLLSSTISP